MLKIIDDKEGLEALGLKYLRIVGSEDERLKKRRYCLLEEDAEQFIDNDCILYDYVECFIGPSGEIEFCKFPECRSEDALIKLVYDLTKNGLAVWEDD